MHNFNFCFQPHWRRYLAAYAVTLKTTTAQYLPITILCNMRSMGSNCPKILGEHRKVVESCLAKPELKDYAQTVIDVIEGRRYFLTSNTKAINIVF